MHQALAIPEILLDIFHHCCPLDLSKEHRRMVIPDLAALARACRTFKEPALDILWEVLTDLSPIVRCLPGASEKLSKKNRFSFNRRLTSDDWDIIQGYTRRIRLIHRFTRGLTRSAITTLSTPPTTEPLFPNLRVLRYEHAERYAPLLHSPLLSLVFLSVEFKPSQLFNDLPLPLPKLCPNIRILSIRVVSSYIMPSKKMDSSHIYRWQNLQSVDCPQLAMDVNTLIHLSRMSALTTLHIKLSNTSLVLNSTLSFANLLDLTLNSASLNAVSQLLSHSRLPAIKNLTACFPGRPSWQDLSFFFSCLQTLTASHTMETFSLTQSHHSLDIDRPLHPLGLEDLQPCLAFCNLRHIEFDIEYHVRLTDADVFTMASAWPKLQHLLINVHFGWGYNVRSGVTPDGLVRVLQMCRSLSQIAVVLDTQGYTTLSPDHAPERLGLTMPPALSIDVLDSPISREHVNAVAAFLSSVATCSELSLVAWHGWAMQMPEMTLDWSQLWEDVKGRLTATMPPGHA